MAITSATARRALQRVGRSSRIQNQFAQAHARRILFDVGESPENFPAFDANLDEAVTVTAYEVIAAASVLAEEGSWTDAQPAFESGAIALEDVHRNQANHDRAAAFHMLVAAMAFYAAGQYSRAFLAMRTASTATPAAAAIAAFLRRDAREAIRISADILLRTQGPLEEEDLATVFDVGIEKGIARAVHLTLDYCHAGDEEGLAGAIGALDDVMELSGKLPSPGWWYVARLFRLMLRDLGAASPWRLLPPLLPTAPHTVSRYIRLHTLSSKPAWEMWKSQREALELTLRDRLSAVINLRTSGGKTRLAELAILQALLENPSVKVLYLAPFRSLALEVEDTLNDTLGILGYTVSHLYGGSRVSSADTKAAADAAILIATPEKARALMRAVPDLAPQLMLIVVDEGHLLGGEYRYVRNEIFLDHLRVLAQKSGARVMLLSAVLPNATEIATWIAGSDQGLAQSKWKPSAERIGTLTWTGQRVELNWRGNVPSFNRSFVVKHKVKLGTTFQFPRNKNEAVAATAARLCTSGPVLVFSARAISIPPLARAAITALRLSELPDHEWPEHEWRVFERACTEDLAPDAIELEAAKLGIICHHAQLPPQVRSSVERLMRARPPRIIIATSTLAQGVNIGACSVIVASVSPGRTPMKKRDFWNICGRAGRAFVDSEGRILYALDATDKKHANKSRQAEVYLSGTGLDHARSGLLLAAEAIRHIAAEAGVRFDRLVELVAEGDVSVLGTSGEHIDEIFDLLDDELLAIHLDPRVNDVADDDVSWVDDVFRHSLAAIQGESGQVKPEELVRLLKARTTALLRRVPDRSTRMSVVGSSLPFGAGLTIHSLLVEFTAIADGFIEAEAGDAGAVDRAVAACENLLRNSRVSVVEGMPSQLILDAIRPAWLAGQGLSLLCKDRETLGILTEFYGYKLPWVLHAIAQQLRASNEPAAEAIDRLALLVEIGVPTERAALIFLAGIRSRSAAAEIASSAGTSPPVWTVAAVARWLLRDAARIKGKVSSGAGEWLELLRVGERNRGGTAPTFEPFVLNGVDTKELHARADASGNLNLCTSDMREVISVVPTQDWPFDRVANDPRFVFAVNEDRVWQLVARDPRIDWWASN